MAEGAPIRMAVEAMGTRFELVLAGHDERHLRAVGEEAILAILRWDLILSIFRADSVATQLNRHAATQPVPVEPDVLELVQRCQDISIQTQGAFDLTVAPLMKELGFHATDGSRSLIEARDSASRQMPLGMDQVLIDEARSTIAFTHRGVALDFGAVGKGQALDDVRSILLEHEVQTALVHGGTSTVLCLGAPPEENAWRVGISDPSSTNVGRRIATASLRDEAMSVSAHSGRQLALADGTAQGHVLDPRSGCPAAAGTLLAGCIADSAMVADAWSTALLVLGRRPDTAAASISTLVLDSAGSLSVAGNREASVRMEGPAI